MYHDPSDLGSSFLIQIVSMEGKFKCLLEEIISVWERKQMHNFNMKYQWIQNQNYWKILKAVYILQYSGMLTFQASRETQIGLRNGVFREVGGKIEVFDWGDENFTWAESNANEKNPLFSLISIRSGSCEVRRLNLALGSGISSRKVSYEWLDVLWEDNRTNNRNDGPNPKTNICYSSPINFTLILIGLNLSLDAIVRETLSASLYLSEEKLLTRMDSGRPWIVSVNKRVCRK